MVFVHGGNVLNVEITQSLYISENSGKRTYATLEVQCRGAGSLQNGCNLLNLRLKIRFKFIPRVIIYLISFFLLHFVRIRCIELLLEGQQRLHHYLQCLEHFQIYGYDIDPIFACNRNDLAGISCHEWQDARSWIERRNWSNVFPSSDILNDMTFRSICVFWVPGSWRQEMLMFISKAQRTFIKHWTNWM